ncbi:acetyl esterase [Novipirellula galeiformis]|uniref:Acetyl esterase n=1 Tax=Novipirellula galeiformis TaxID=2528004 RepID=A0A5C6CMX4_9BACT|nr:alpha/beta hydrolase fold domain-containing protein [Novipirellula galeiformis]TWU25435.1 acetyl esterase [Novipirellula galeiformis]
MSSNDSVQKPRFVPRLLTAGIPFLVVFCMTTAEAQDKQIRYAPMHRLTMDEYEGTLRFWQTTYPQWVTLESRGLSGQNLPVYLVKITDRDVSDEDKQICLITTLHCGPERTGASGAMAFVEWMLSGDPLAAETRRRQIILVMPVVNPLSLFHTDRWRNEHGVEPYAGLDRKGKLWDVKTLTIRNPQDAPELMAVLSVVDEYQPEVHADFHGTGLQEYSPDQLGTRRTYHGQIMTEITGSAYSNNALRPWDWRVTEAMIEAGNAAGFPSDRFEADAQRTFWGTELDPLSKRLWQGKPMFYSQHYSYAKYHTMLSTHEVAWEQSIVARMKGLLSIGNNVWNDERQPSYPVNRIKNFVGHFVTAYGNTAAQRRKSRVELWSKQAQFSLGFLYPQTVGRESLVCTTTAAAKRAVAAADFRELQLNLHDHFGADAGNIRNFIEAGPEFKLGMGTPRSQLLAATDTDDVRIENGISFRLRLPYRNPSQLDVQLNGQALKPSATDGYETWFADGFTQVHVNVPPTKASKTELYFITCGYEPNEVRPNGWMPPAAVQQRFATAKADATPATFTDMPYGEHFRQTMDLWLAPVPNPTPLVFYLHGGGWAAQDKTDIHQHLDVRALLNAGISVASVNYRLLQDASAADVSPPVQWPLNDAARALQFVRSNASQWRIDKARIGACGVSAGGCSSLWLALHDDMAEANSDDLIARESTRLWCAAGKAPQTSLDPLQLKEWIPNYEYGGRAFGFPGATRPDAFAPFLAARDSLLPHIRRYSPIEHVSNDDPPIFMEFPEQDKDPIAGESQADPTHSAVSGLMLQRKLQSLGVESELRYRGDRKTGGTDMQQFLTLQLLRDELR